jgi:hypothetical protein
MRLGLLGPAEGNLEALARAAELLLNTARVERAIYLGADDALDRVVEAWASSIVGDDPSDGAIWDRACPVALKGTPKEIDDFVLAERARLRLKALEELPQDRRSVEMFADRVAVLIHDKAALDEEDIFSATFLVYGKSDVPLVKQIGSRWFLTPGKIGAPGGGALVLDDEGEAIVGSLYDGEGKRTQHEQLVVTRAAKVRVQGSP